MFLASNGGIVPMFARASHAESKRVDEARNIHLLDAVFGSCSHKYACRCDVSKLPGVKVPVVLRLVSPVLQKVGTGDLQCQRGRHAKFFWRLGQHLEQLYSRPQIFVVVLAGRRLERL